MNPEKQRIAIAEACGWHQSDKGWWFNREETNGGDPEPPDYLHDLNAMHEAENTLGDKWEDYRDALCGVCATDCAIDNKLSNPWWNATSDQRAEAFLRTIRKWGQE